MRGSRARPRRRARDRPSPGRARWPSTPPPRASCSGSVSVRPVVISRIARDALHAAAEDHREPLRQAEVALREDAEARERRVRHVGNRAGLRLGGTEPDDRGEARVGVRRVVAEEVHAVREDRLGDDLGGFRPVAPMVPRSVQLCVVMSTPEPGGVPGPKSAKMCCARIRGVALHVRRDVELVGQCRAAAAPELKPTVSFWKSWCGIADLDERLVAGQQATA